MQIIVDETGKKVIYPDEQLYRYVVPRTSKSLLAEYSSQISAILVRYDRHSLSIQNIEKYVKQFSSTVSHL